LSQTLTSGLTQAQIQSILSLLQSFGADQSIINNVAATLGKQTTGVGDGFVFNNFLSVGSTGTDVTELQKHLTALGAYSGPVTGYFGSLTQAAVEQFQGTHGISQVGYVGPATRAALNQ
jgi:peptidoglycan hydrolase-like protein with peptidoglycan-binding domain